MLPTTTFTCRGKLLQAAVAVATVTDCCVVYAVRISIDSCFSTMNAVLISVYVALHAVNTVSTCAVRTLQMRCKLVLALVETMVPIRYLVEDEFRNSRVWLSVVNACQERLSLLRQQCLVWNAYVAFVFHVSNKWLSGKWLSG